MCKYFRLGCVLTDIISILSGNSQLISAFPVGNIRYRPCPIRTLRNRFWISVMEEAHLIKKLQFQGLRWVSRRKKLKGSFTK